MISHGPANLPQLISVGGLFRSTHLVGDLRDLFILFLPHALLCQFLQILNLSLRIVPLSGYEAIDLLLLVLALLMRETAAAAMVSTFLAELPH